MLSSYLYSHIHTFIFLISKKSFSQNISGENTGKYNENYRGRNINKFKAIKTIGFGLGACIFSWMPDLILLCVNCYYVITNDSGEIHSSAFVAWFWVEAIAFTSSAINPFKYYFRNQDYRQAFCRTFRWLPCELTGESSQQIGLKPRRHLMI